MNSSTIVQKLWNYCNVLRDGGMSYGDYVEQLTYLLFLKMADERTKPPYNQETPVPHKWSWPELIKRDGEKLFEHYRHTLEALGNKPGLLGLIFNKSQNKFQDPAKLLLHHLFFEFASVCSHLFLLSASPRVFHSSGQLS